jgi:antitoxin (DNA-binding transcriptional repressor) of toxin-antitoxin stability system
MVASDAMEERISTIDVRQQIGDLLNRVALRQDKFVIERKGRALAALVPVERLDQLRRFARRHGLEFIERQRGAGLTDRKAGDLAREATGWARRRAGKAPRTR